MITRHRGWKTWRKKTLKKWFSLFVIGSHLNNCGLEFNILVQKT